MGVRAWTADDEVDVETGYVEQPTASTQELPDFEVLDVRPARDPMGTLRAAVDPSGLANLWSAAGYEDEPPAVDFDRWVLVTITIPDDACPPTLSGFERVGTVLTPSFDEPAACVQPLIPKTFVVTLKRSMVTPSFTIRLPGAGVTALLRGRAAPRGGGA